MRNIDKLAGVYPPPPSVEGEGSFIGYIHRADLDALSTVLSNTFYDVQKTLVNRKKI